MIEIHSYNVNSVRMGLLILVYHALAVVKSYTSISIWWDVDVDIL